MGGNRSMGELIENFSTKDHRLARNGRSSAFLQGPSSEGEGARSLEWINSSGLR